ncbi:sensor histidine kinase [Mucilaginibacter sp. McL0603]|uniref:sensor histidine kinase n=1 Tax=Mucilaginibacter sp. McL0603 TaxID=3415670 RepID=UPI003CF08045
MSKLYVFALMTAYSSGAYAQEISRHGVDSLLKVTIHVNAAQVAYERGNKEDDIRLRDQNISLLKQNARLQQALWDEAVRLRNETITGILILLICVGLFYRQYRLRQKSDRLVSQKNKIITEKNELFDRVIKENEWLLIEVHDRVKNNLHTILSLLESQSIFLENEAYRALEDSRGRVYAMSLIHQQLYRSEDINAINISIYLSEFVCHLQQSPVAHKIHFELNAAPIQLSLSQAMPLALIINEAVTNSIKFAFPGKRSGEIKINLSRTDELIKLVIADNGIGIDPVLLDTSRNSLGITLIKGLTEDIKGTLQFESNKGTCVTLSFNADYFYHPPVLG